MLSPRVSPHRRLLAAGVVGLLLVLGVGGCGGDDSAERPAELSATEHNAADVAFAKAMIQHHAQALAMVDLTLQRPLDPAVEELALQIRQAQGPEIETMADWLTQWGHEVPETMRDHGHAGHDVGDPGEAMEGMDGGADMPGMMSAAQLTALAEAPDDEFQARWLELMIEHHTGAVTMARTEQQEGRFRPTVELAADIAEGQQAEVEQMERLLDR